MIYLQYENKTAGFDSLRGFTSLHTLGGGIQAGYQAQSSFYSGNWARRIAPY
jgi:hypothetical protein